MRAGCEWFESTTTRFTRRRDVIGLNDHVHFTDGTITFRVVRDLGSQCAVSWRGLTMQVDKSELHLAPTFAFTSETCNDTRGSGG